MKLRGAAFGRPENNEDSCAARTCRLNLLDGRTESYHVAPVDRRKRCVG